MTDQTQSLRLGSTTLEFAPGPAGVGVTLLDDGAPLWQSATPVEIEHFDGETRHEIAVAYDRVEPQNGALVGRARVPLGGATVAVVDTWRVASGHLRLERRCNVAGAGQGGFNTRLRLTSQQANSQTMRVFVPAMIYGGPQHLTAAAIGGADTWNPQRAFTTLIREDRMPAPLVLFYLPGGRHLALFDAAPTGHAPLADTRDVTGETLLVEGITLNSLGFAGEGQRFEALFCTPANEGEVTYQGTTYPRGQMHTWRRRYQRLRDGAAIGFACALRVSAEDDFGDAARAAWRAAWAHLAPEYPVQPIEAITDALVLRMTAQVGDVAAAGGRPAGRGLPNFLERNRIPPLHRDHLNAVIGFTGKNLEAANVMLRWSDDHPDAEGARVRAEAEAIIATMLHLKVDPPEAEGYVMATGEPTPALPHEGCLYLRSFGDDLKVLARAYLREKANGREHPAWRAWIESFGRWLLTQQRADGSLPRTWLPVTGEVKDPSPYSTYNAIPLLTLLHTMTGEARYLDAAIAAGDFCWNAGQADFVFIGGTIDNPDIIDKEAGTLSLEGYLALWFATQETRWIERARRAADFAETWIFLWNVPISPDEDDARLHWKKGLPTIGLQPIATGHSLVDMYMAFDVDEFAKVYMLTGDAHYLDVARLLLHATKTMISIPGRLFDLEEPGWQQEHWTLAPKRGYGLHRGWLPWNTTSQLAGIYDLKDFDAALYARLVAGA